MGAKGQQHGRWLQIDFMRRRYLWFAISGAIVLIAVGSLAVRGLNFGIDFKGGTQITFSRRRRGSWTTCEPTRRRSTRSSRRRSSRAAARPTDGKYRELPDADEDAQPERRPAAARRARSRSCRRRTTATKSVSESFGRQIARSAILAIFVSLFLIVLYLAIRFDYKYALPVIAALVHDIVITVGVYSVSGREVTTATVAAVLTVLGYSIYDTIIIFDRVRENVPLMRRASFATIANVSLWETIRRSLATTFITLLPVASLLIFGGATLKDFAFALMVGITSGAYSSIFIAAPLLTMLKEREPEWTAKIGQADVGRRRAACRRRRCCARPSWPRRPSRRVPEMAPVAEDGRRERRRSRGRSRSASAGGSAGAARPHGRADNARTA